MSLFKKKKKEEWNDIYGSEDTEEIVINDFGEDIHVFNGEWGEVRVKKINPSAYLYHDEQWCPDCHVLLIKNSEHFECPNCNYSITISEAESGEGYPSLESTYEDDYCEYYGNNNYEDDF